VKCVPGDDYILHLSQVCADHSLSAAVPAL
jgi:hypothetical protein